MVRCTTDHRTLAPCPCWSSRLRALRLMTAAEDPKCIARQRAWSRRLLKSMQSTAAHGFSGCRARQRMALTVLARAGHPARHAGPRGLAWMCRGCQPRRGVCHAGPRIRYPHAAPGPAHHTPLPGWPQQSIQDALLGPATCGGMHGAARPTIRVQAAGPSKLSGMICWTPKSMLHAPRDSIP